MKKLKALLYSIALVALVAIVWQGNPYLGLVVRLALAVNTMVAVSIGGVLPVS